LIDQSTAQPAREMNAAPRRGLSIAALIVAGESAFLLEP
jgi:hypothetical protein